MQKDWNYKIMVDNDEIFVVNTTTDECVYTFSDYDYYFANNLLRYIGCDADLV